MSGKLDQVLSQKESKKERRKGRKERRKEGRKGKWEGYNDIKYLFETPIMSSV